MSSAVAQETVVAVGLGAVDKVRAAALSASTNKTKYGYILLQLPREFSKINTGAKPLA